MNLSQLQVVPRPQQHPLMSGDVGMMMKLGLPVAIPATEQDHDAIEQELPKEEWKLAIEPRPWGSRTLLLVAPPDHRYNLAFLAEYRLAPQRDRRELARHDWRNAEPSPNPGLLAYYISNSLTAVTIPLMAKEGVRHDFYRHFFLEVNGAPNWRHPLSYHNSPGIWLSEEHELVEDLRRSMPGGPWG